MGQPFAVLLLTGVLYSLTLAAPAPEPAPGFSAIAPLLARKCNGCHQPGGIAPSDFTTYETARPWARAIAEAVALRKMPPWYAEPGVGGPFANDRSLAPEEIAQIRAWASGGALRGDPLPHPAAPPDSSAGWSLGQPDRIWKAPAFALPASGELPYTYFLIPRAFAEDTWVTWAELRPKARGTVHHFVAYTRPPGSSYLRGSPAGKYFVPDAANRDRILGPESPFDWRELLAVYTPGTAPLPPVEGTARLVKAGSDLIFELHYTPDGTQSADVPELGIKLAEAAPRKRLLTASAANGKFVIPPGAPDVPVEAQVAFRQDVELISMMPHMHLRGKSFEYRVVYPSGLVETLLRVPSYNFNWQINYQLSTPLLIPRGSRLVAEAHFDNSANNPFNPDPAREVRWGDRTSDEMMVGFFDIAFPARTEPRELFFGLTAGAGAPPE